MFLASFLSIPPHYVCYPLFFKFLLLLPLPPLCFIFLSDQSVPLISVSLKGPVLVTILRKNVFFSCERMFQASVIAL